MAMLELTPALRRGTGKERNRKLLAQGKVSGVIYGKNLPTRLLEFDRRELEKFLSVARRGTVVVKMTIRDGDGAMDTYAVLKEVQEDSVSNLVIHVDFYEVAPGQRFRIEVPVRLKGKAAGMEQGGILDQVVRSLEVECTPDSVPEYIEVDVTPLGIGDAVHLEDLAFPRNVSPMERDGKMTIVSMHALRVEEVVTVTPEEATAGTEGASVAESREKD
jgi:large subunit ribosomal protein L25